MVAKRLRGKVVTLSFSVDSGSSVNLSAYIQCSATADSAGGGAAWNNVVSPLTVTVSSTKTRYTLTWTIPNDASAAGIRVAFRTTNMTNGVAYDLMDVQLEEGPVATPFEERPIGLELALCQRYYETSNGQVAGAAFYNGSITSGSLYAGRVKFHVQKRTETPTITLAHENASGFATAAGTLAARSSAGFQESRTATSTIPAGFFSTHWNADAEL